MRRNGLCPELAIARIGAGQNLFGAAHRMNVDTSPPKRMLRVNAALMPVNVLKRSN